jgi:hypothetical protein
VLNGLQFLRINVKLTFLISFNCSFKLYSTVSCSANFKSSTVLSVTILSKSFFTLTLLVKKKYLVFISLFFCILFKNSALDLNRIESEPAVLLPDADLI